MKRIVSGLLVAAVIGIAGFLGTFGAAHAQAPATVKLCQGTPTCVPVSASAPLQVAGTFSATIAGFAPGLAYASLTATGSSASVGLPAGTVVMFQNTGTTTVSCTLGVGSAVATAGMNQVPASSTVPMVVGSNTFGACIDESGSVSNVVRLSGGSGLASGFGGGGGGGGGGAVTIANGADVALGTTTDAVAATPAGAGAATLIALAKAINNNVASAIPTGANLIGDVNLRQGGTALSLSNAAFFKQTDGTTVQVTDPCQGSTKSYLPITATTSLVKVIATGVAAKKLYICQLLLTVTAADNVAVFEATTGTTCATSAVAVFGAGTSVATAANGFPFPANGGVSLGTGGFSVGQTTVNNNDLCIGTSAATPLTGGITYVTQ
jgi:hypothetical protein